MSHTYTFAIPAILAFDIEADSEAEAIAEAARMQDRSLEPDEYIRLCGPYLRLADELPTLEETYPATCACGSYDLGECEGCAKQETPGSDQACTTDCDCEHNCDCEVSE